MTIESFEEMVKSNLSLMLFLRMKKERRRNDAAKYLEKVSSPHKKEEVVYIECLRLAPLIMVHTK